MWNDRAEYIKSSCTHERHVDSIKRTQQLKREKKLLHDNSPTSLLVVYLFQFFFYFRFLFSILIFYMRINFVKCIRKKKCCTKPNLQQMHTFERTDRWMKKNWYLHATSMVADWLFALPRGDHAWQSHLNGVLPKYSKTKSFDMVAVTSCKWTPVCGSTCDSTVDGGGCELPLHLKVSCNENERKMEIHVSVKKWRFIFDYVASVYAVYAVCCRDSCCSMFCLCFTGVVVFVIAIIVMSVFFPRLLTLIRTH